MTTFLNSVSLISEVNDIRLYVGISETPTPPIEAFAKEQKSCKGNNYGSFPTMDKAKSKCSEDPRCIGVYDQGCDDKKFFSLCHRGYELESSGSSCTYIEGR